MIRLLLTTELLRTLVYAIKVYDDRLEKDGHPEQCSERTRLTTLANMINNALSKPCGKVNAFTPEGNLNN